MVRFLSVKAKLMVFALTIVCLVAACSPQAPASSSGDSIPHFNDIVNAVSSGSAQELSNLVKYSSLPCTKTDGLGGPPKCLASEAEGTRVEVLPILGPEGHYLRRSELSSWQGIGAAQLYAAYRVAEGTYSDEFFPAGEFGVAFQLANQPNFVVFQVTEDGIVRVDYLVPPSMADLLESSEVILTPIPPQ